MLSLTGGYSTAIPRKETVVRPRSRTGQCECFFDSHLSIFGPYVVSIRADATHVVHIVIVVWVPSIPAFRIVGPSELVRLSMDMRGSAWLLASFSFEIPTSLLITLSSPFCTQLCGEYEENLFFWREKKGRSCVLSILPSRFSWGGMTCGSNERIQLAFPLFLKPPFFSFPLRISLQKQLPLFLSDSPRRWHMNLSKYFCSLVRSLILIRVSL